MSRPTFEEWAAAQLCLSRNDIESIKLIAAFDILLSRLEAAQHRRARDPLVTITNKKAGGNSRACTKRMLEQLGFTPSQRRAVHRLLAGSSSGWPGLLHLYVGAGDLDPAQRQYARRQVQALR